MTDNDEQILRRSLDAVDRTRTRLVIATVVTGVLLLAGFVHGAQAVHSHDTNLFLHAVMVILAVWTTLMTLVVVLQITAMTKRILRAIELASRK
jgi:hypothetical protein